MANSSIVSPSKGYGEKRKREGGREKREEFLERGMLQEEEEEDRKALNDEMMWTERKTDGKKRKIYIQTDRQTDYKNETEIETPTRSKILMRI